MSRSAQPAWWAVAKTGDVNVLEEGGGYLLVDRRNIYAPEWNVWAPERRQLSRISLERCHMTPDGAVGDNRFHVGMAAWFGESDRLVSAAATCDQTEEQLMGLLVSSNPLERLKGYEALVEHHGVYEFDQHPVDYEPADARRLFRRFERQITAAARWPDGYA